MNGFGILWFLSGFLSTAGLLVYLWWDDPLDEILVEDVGTVSLALIFGTLFGFIPVLLSLWVIWEELKIGKKVLWKKDDG